MRRIGLYGGSFDPIHHGHLISARSLAERLDLERVFLIPAARPPHKPHVQLTGIEHRLAMARLAVDGDPLFDVLDIEAHRAGPSYSIDTVDQLRSSFGPDAEMFWFIGGDTLPELPMWHRVRELVGRVTIVTATRPGWRSPGLGLLAEAVGEPAARALLDHCLATPSIGISASEIRSRCAAGKSIRYLTPANVERYVVSHRLYGAADFAEQGDNLL
jgi:nicotinate-nucleotide adenylyltransferase